MKQIAKQKDISELAAYASLQLQKGVSLKQLRTDINLSERSLERLFQNNIGLSPKLYSRICRFQASLAILRNANFTSLTEIAYLEDYFDQSHFIRDFNFFSGTTPKKFLINANERVPDFPEWKF